MMIINRFDWEPFYSEFADKLLTFKNDRKSLLNKIKKVFDLSFEKTGLKFPFYEKDGKMLDDICPFTVMGCFNRNLKRNNRIVLTETIKKEFGIIASVPTDFDGIPVMDSRNAWLFSFIEDRGNSDIDMLWTLFEEAIRYADSKGGTRQAFIEAYNSVYNLPLVKWKLSIVLYWIRPGSYINLDSCNREYLLNSEIDISDICDLKKVPTGDQYLEIIQKCKSIFNDSNTKYHSFAEFSHKAWTHLEETKQDWFSADYVTKLSTEQWTELLKDHDVFNSDGLNIVKRFKDYGGAVTCKQLADKYGETPSYYNMGSTQLAKRIQNKTGCNVPENAADNAKWWPILYVGKYSNDKKDGTYIWKLRDELSDALDNVDLSDTVVTKKEEHKLDISKNTILYGPPGTGKTYNTVIYAVAIIENKMLNEVKSEQYETVLERYNRYKADGLIEFTTFHQSYGYEEFIEGIKPIIDNDSEEKNGIQYDVMPGVFKKFCNETSVPSNMGLNPYPTVWKVSLEGTGENTTRTECLKNNHIRIGWDEYGEAITDDTDFKDGGKAILNAFICKMKRGDIVFSCYSATTIDAIGVISGDYEWHDEYSDYKRVRSVNWIVKDIREDITTINNGLSLTLSAVYKLNIAVEDVMKIISQYTPDISQTIKKETNRVFIIDEINRGNISKIFGELITLIEPTKRIGQNEEMKVILPYSQKMFGVPDNVFLLGTMNTADRSIAMIDTALRRRFRFKEIMPNASVLDGINVEGVSIKDMFIRINKRITALYDREHTIGHSFFLPLKDNPTIDNLAVIFSDDIIPLLQEYFYEDYEKIRMVLGDNIADDDSKRFIIASQNNYEELFGSAEGFDDAFSYEINKEAFNNIEAYRKI